MTVTDAAGWGTSWDSIYHDGDGQELSRRAADAARAELVARGADVVSVTAAYRRRELADAENLEWGHIDLALDLGAGSDAEVLGYFAAGAAVAELHRLGARTS